MNEMETIVIKWVLITLFHQDSFTMTCTRLDAYRFIVARDVLNEFFRITRNKENWGVPKTRLHTGNFLSTILFLFTRKMCSNRSSCTTTILYV